MNKPLNELSITEAAKKLDAGDITAVDVVRSCLAEIEKNKPADKSDRLNAYVEVFDDCLAEAKLADERRTRDKEENKKSHELLGIPLAIKDNILIEGRKGMYFSISKEEFNVFLQIQAENL